MQVKFEDNEKGILNITLTKIEIEVIIYFLNYQPLIISRFVSNQPPEK